MARKGLAKPVGSMTQYDKIRVGRGADKKYLHYKDIVPLADLNDIVVHIFQQDVRELFRIESLWKESPALYGEMPTVSPRRAEPAGDEE